MKISHIRGAIFDFDGVLADSTRIHQFSWKQAFSDLFKKEFPSIPTEKLSGGSAIRISETLAALAGQPDQAPVLYQRKQEILLDDSLVPQLLPGAKEILNFFNHRSIPYAIASNAQKAYLLKTVAYYSLPVSFVLGCEDFPLPKPAPEAFIQCTEFLQLKPSPEIVVFEDSPECIAGAVNAGLTGIGIGVKPGNFTADAASAWYPALQDFLIQCIS
jgi:beta-phosphoglucomutase